MLERIKASTATDEVVKQILRLIKEGKMKSGDKLPNEVDLMKELNVGRSTIREAKRVLTSKNVLESHPGRGTFIKSINADGFLDQDILDLLLIHDDILNPLYETREIFETEMAVLAAEKATQSDLKYIKSNLTIMEESRTENELYENGVKFHMSIAKASKNPVLIQIYKAIMKSLTRNQKFVYDIKITEEIRIHSDIYEAIQKRDANLTRHAMVKHFEYVRKQSLKDVKVEH